MSAASVIPVYAGDIKKCVRMFEKTAYVPTLIQIQTVTHDIIAQEKGCRAADDGNDNG